jgi:N-acyl-D-aspartate/D-glutamate deacylase
VLETRHPALASYEGKTMHEIAALQGKRPVDASLDLAIADHLLTRF